MATIEKLSNYVKETEKYMNYWRSLTEDQQRGLSIFYYNDSNYQSLTGSQIKYIYYKENNLL